MAKNIWNATLDVNNDVKQNPFDWNHVNNLTLNIGQITPVFCDLVPAKTSFRVKNDFGLQLMPMVFPIQTRMRATISWFRYPLRALWKDYKDYVGNFREGLVEPYINFNTADRLKKMASTGSLGDYLGLPTTKVGAYGQSVNATAIIPTPCASGKFSHMDSDVSVGAEIDLSCVTGSLVTSGNYLQGITTPSFEFLKIGVDSFTVTFIVQFSDDYQGVYNFIRSAGLALCTPESFCAYYSDSIEPSIDVLDTASGHSVYKVTYSVKVSDISTDYSELSQAYLVYDGQLFTNYIYSNTAPSNPQDFDFLQYFAFPSSSPSVRAGFTPKTASVVQELTLSTSPWYNSNSVNKEKQIKISAYAFRAYEGIYNCYIRDNRNNPYYINGEVQYNNWIPTYEGGEDNNLYELRYANWEKDFLTTAVQSPQQGNAPLVGITTYETGRVLENGNLETKVALVDETGARYAVEFEQSEEGLENVSYIELDNGTRVRQARSLMDLATSGISIPDLRLVNCYQKYLELNMRKGYSYKDIVEGRFDVKVRYADLLQPEFFGGTSRNLNMNSISQTVDNDPTGSGAYKDVLGSQAGVGYFSGSNDANIECFCDEESIIMGLLTITPLPVYTQLLPKHFTYRELLDHFNPEFNNLGFQPISYKEVCPIQAFNANPDSLTKTFGYQRPWYEYCQRYDQAHGLFRTDLSNFLMHRVFNEKPELAQSFLVIDPEQVTDVFSVTDVTDKIYGQVLLDITVKLPVARVAIPRLD
nr:MAG TPA: Major capsid protein [Bacteriophage sp.]